MPTPTVECVAQVAPPLERGDTYYLPAATYIWDGPKRRRSKHNNKTTNLTPKKKKR